jgi:hypothetical protein
MNPLPFFSLRKHAFWVPQIECYEFSQESGFIVGAYEKNAAVLIFRFW